MRQERSHGHNVLSMQHEGGPVTQNPKDQSARGKTKARTVAVGLGNLTLTLMHDVEAAATATVLQSQYFPRTKSCLKTLHKPCRTPVFINGPYRATSHPTSHRVQMKTQIALESTSNLVPWKTLMPNRRQLQIKSAIGHGRVVKSLNNHINVGRKSN